MKQQITTNPRVCFLTILLSVQLFCYAQSYISRVPLPTGSYNTIDYRIRTILKADESGTIWLGFGTRKIGSIDRTSTIGLCKYSNGSWTVYNKTNSAIPSLSLTSIAFQNTTVWIGSKEGLIKFDGTNFTSYKTSNSNIPNDTINDVCVSGNTLWMATNAGICKYDGSIFTKYTKQNSTLGEDFVSSIATADNSTVYMGTNNGLYTYKNGTFSNLNASNSGLLSNLVSAIQLDKAGNLWMSADSGTYIPSVYVLKNGTITNLVNGVASFNGCNLAYFPTKTLGFAVTNNGAIYFPSYQNNAGLNALINLFEVNGSSLTGYTFFESNLKNKVYPYLITAKADNILLLPGDNINDSIALIDMSKYAYMAQDTGIKYLSINKVNTPIPHSTNILYWDKNIEAHYEVPKGTCKKTIYAGSLWIGGVTNSNLHLAAQTYAQSGGNDYYPGPLDTVTGTSNISSSAAYKKVWKVERTDIENFKKSFANGNVANGTYKIPVDMLTWPAHGTGNTSRNLAPFVDVDFDGLYNPFKGDYPKIKGDQMLYWITNDNPNYSAHTESGGLPMGIELHGSAYAFQCNDFSETDSNSLINYVTFYHFDIFNRGLFSYDTARVGLWIDADLGNYSDDYTGCNPKNNYFNFYNGDDNDEGLILGYGLNPPTASVQILKSPNGNTGLLNKFVYYNNDFSVTGNPTVAAHYWNYLNGQWKDGQPITYGGSGRGGSDTASHMFPGADDLAGRISWTESIAGNTPGDRRGLGVSGVFTYNSGQKVELDYAIIHTRSNGGAISYAQTLKDNLMVKRWFNEGTYPSCLKLNVGTEETLNSTAPFKVYPNPATGNLNLDFVEAAGSREIMLMDLLDRSIKRFSTSEQHLQINIAELSKGIYVLRVKIKDTYMSTKIVIE